MDRYKKINLYAVFSFAALAVCAFFTYKFNCFNSCEYFFLIGTLSPVFVFSTGVLLSLVLLLCFSSNIFKFWIYSIALWYLPLIAVLIYVSPARTGSILGIDRSLVTIWLVFILFFITVIYIVVYKIFFSDKS